jgi:hypothetical protein
MQLIVQLDGTVHCLYGEQLDLNRLGMLKIARGSLVEPTSDGQWTADLSPVNGPVLGPYRSRREALASEVRWLETHWLPMAH